MAHLISWLRDVGVFQLHRNVRPGAVNAEPGRIANVDEACKAQRIDPARRTRTASTSPSTVPAPSTRVAPLRVLALVVMATHRRASASHRVSLAAARLRRLASAGKPRLRRRPGARACQPVGAVLRALRHHAGQRRASGPAVDRAHGRVFRWARPHPTRAVEGFQTRPVLVGDLLVVTTTTSKVIALDAETRRRTVAVRSVRGPRRARASRRIAASRVWQAARRRRRERTIFSGTCDGVLVALDPATGSCDAAFADGGVLDLRPGADARPGEQYG